MRIFLTGATGYVGSAVLDALVRGGHRVEALVRDPERAAAVARRGAQLLVGNLAEPSTYADAVAAADGVIHVALESSPRAAEVDALAIETVLQHGRRGDHVFIYTSSAWVLGPQPEPADETAGLRPSPLVAWRPAHEHMVLGAAGSGRRTAVIRPGIVYGGARGFVSDLVKDAANGLVRIVGPGENHWPLVYDRDLGELYLRLANAPDACGVFHANDEGDERVKDIVEAIGRQMPFNPSIRRMPLREAQKKLGPLADALALDQKIRSPRARALGWAPSLHSVAGNAPRLFEEWRRGREAASVP